jgi:hypothetical protein
MKKYFLAAAMIFGSVIPSYAQHHYHNVPVPPHRPHNLGRNVGIGAGILGLGILGSAIILNESRRPDCLIGYDRYGRPVYDEYCNW